MIEQLLQTALDAVQDGRPVVLVSVVRATGSTPRAAGALLLAGPDGLLAARAPLPGVCRLPPRHAPPRDLCIGQPAGRQPGHGVRRHK